MNQREDREPIFDFLRVVAAFFVIVVHVSALTLYHRPIGSSAWKTAFVYDALAHAFVPLFFMISGRFLLDPAYPCSSGKIIRKSARLLLAFCVFSFAYLLYVFLPSFYGLASVRSNIGWLAERFVRGEAHLWFLWALIGLYLITPILRQIVLNRTAVQWFLLLFAVFQILIPLLFRIPKLGYLVELAGVQIKMRLVMGYSGYYVLGWVLHEQKLKTGLKVPLYMAGVFGMVCNILSSMGRSVSGGDLFFDRFDYVDPLVIVSAVSLYLAAMDLSRRFPRLGSGRGFCVLSAYSFGIYLTHMFVINLLQQTDLLWWAEPWIAVPLDALAVMIISLLLAWLIRRIPWLGKRIT